jgi:hypothetical protein
MQALMYLTYIHFQVCALYACMKCIVVLRMVSYFNVTALVESIQLIQ